jgi:DNA repair protein RadC
MTYSLRVADLPVSDRPREKLIAHGARYLTTAELIAILLGTGQGAGTPARPISGTASS